MKGICLLGGPFDGDRALNRHLRMAEPPPILWVIPAPGREGDTQWFLKAVRGAEVYEQDELDDKGWLIYKWRELHLDGDSRRERETAGELVGAGAGPVERPA